MSEFARISVAGMKGYCGKPKCLRKCTTTKIGHSHGPSKTLDDPCHEGPCWPTPKEDS